MRYTSQIRYGGVSHYHVLEVSYHVSCSFQCVSYCGKAGNAHAQIRGPHDIAVRLVREEVERYKDRLSKKGIQYKINTEAAQSDGSVILKIRKQNLRTPVGEYMD
jgi:hypothetical protein